MTQSKDGAIEESKDASLPRQAIGHFRRYIYGKVRTISPAALRFERIIHQDCTGLVLSAANMLLLNQSMPTSSQLGFWDRWIIPISRVLDKVFLYSVGKTIFAVWRKGARS